MVSIINSGYSKDGQMMHSIRCLFFVLAVWDILLYACHIPESSILQRMPSLVIINSVLQSSHHLFLSLSGAYRLLWLTFISVVCRHEKLLVSSTARTDRHWPGGPSYGGYASAMVCFEGSMLAGRPRRTRLPITPEILRLLHSSLESLWDRLSCCGQL